MHDHHHQYQAGGNRQEYLFHPNRSQTLSHHQQQQQQQHSAASDMRTPVAWALRDATLSHPRSPANPNVPFNMATQHQLTHAFDSISLRQPSSSSISGRDQPHHRIRHNQQQHQIHHHPYPYLKSKQQQQHLTNGTSRHQRTSSPSATTTSSDDRDEIPIVRHPHHRRHHHGADGRRSVISSRASHLNHGMHNNQHPPPGVPMMHHPSLAYTSDHHHHPSHRNPYGITMGTLRSTKSVPALALHPQQQHDNCPVHGQEYPIFHPHLTHHQHHRHPTGAYSVIHAPIYADRRMLAGASSVMDLRSLPPLPPSAGPPQAPALITNFEAKKLQTAIQLPQGMYPTGRHLMMQQSKQICSPLDLYDPVTAAAVVNAAARREPSCCKGHLIVLWIILSVVMMGVISGIILGVTMN